MHIFAHPVLLQLYHPLAWQIGKKNFIVGGIAIVVYNFSLGLKHGQYEGLLANGGLPVHNRFACNSNFLLDRGSRQVQKRRPKGATEMDHIVVIILHEKEIEGLPLDLLKKEVRCVLGRVEIVVFVCVLVAIDAKDIEQGVVEDN